MDLRIPGDLCRFLSVINIAEYGPFQIERVIEIRVSSSWDEEASCVRSPPSWGAYQRTAPYRGLLADACDNALMCQELRLCCVIPPFSSLHNLFSGMHLTTPDKDVLPLSVLNVFLWTPLQSVIVWPFYSLDVLVRMLARYLSGRDQIQLVRGIQLKV